MSKGSWTPKEDAVLLDYLQKMGGHYDNRNFPKVHGRSLKSTEARYYRLISWAKEGRAISYDRRPPPVFLGEDPAIPVEWAPPQEEREVESKSFSECARTDQMPVGELGGDVAKLVSVLGERRNDAFDLEELCDRLEMSPKRTRELVEKAQKLGFGVAIAGSEIGFAPSHVHSPLRTHDIEVEQPGERRLIVVAGDPHIGSRYHMGKQFHDFVDKGMARAHALGIKGVIGVCAGDFLDGIYKFSRYEQTAQGFEQQAMMAADGGLPKREGLSWFGISGNHDETFEMQSGMIAHRALVDTFRREGRNDLTMIGARGGYLRLLGPGDDPEKDRGVFVELWHPRGSPAYAISYKTQKKIEAYQPGQKPDFLFAGHYHQHNYSEVRGVHAFLTGCWQSGQSSFGKSIGTAPSIGSWIIEYTVTPSGTVREVNATWVRYYEQETVRVIGLT